LTVSFHRLCVGDRLIRSKDLFWQAPLKVGLFLNGFKVTGVKFGKIENIITKSGSFVIADRSRIDIRLWNCASDFAASAI